jgi:hypothetical protein
MSEVRRKNQIEEPSHRVACAENIIEGEGELMAESITSFKKFCGVGDADSA